MSFDLMVFRGRMAVVRLHLARADAAVLQGDQHLTGEAIQAAQDALLEVRILWSKMPRTRRKKRKVLDR